MTSQVAFLGLGAMGAPMARNLANAGFATRAWNRTPKPVEHLEANGVAVTAELAAAVAGAEFVLMCVLDDAASETVLSQALPHLQADTIVLDHSTIGVDTARRLAAQAAEVGVHYLDAPVSGGTAGAEAGTLSIMLGGAAAIVERCDAVLNAIGARYQRMGPSGSGQATKLVNQLLTAVHSAAAVEALNLGRQLGLELDALQDILSRSFGASRMLERTVPELQKGQFQSAFTVDVLSKDLGLIERLGKTTGTPLPFGETAYRLYRSGQQAGLGGLDAAALVRLLEPKKT
ncbi:hypothetical protein CAI21_14795 [Alkalilimnicola ehrlichii]|uniref:2-hydroxy-3-oxopropionate reductase n=1 Tax=Alkalilimnicola ehrlichii TaxID=351052 RepID=A0A3E0WR07_9GAMM|nr:NAD(P)-dependent oxidoreductase [Alkalilimnicola ehrlichii]RFA27306.1 hypothetical protein CAI21_14795 [Alkalilimnicola ehrlichii]RFA34415.1 hypothetical protein CAL65_15365 [Alkalilimnicola ehrlichii]